MNFGSWAILLVQVFGIITATVIESDAEFALWYRSIVPKDWQLEMYDSGLYFDIIHSKPETTAVEILAGFEIQFDIRKYE